MIKKQLFLAFLATNLCSLGTLYSQTTEEENLIPLEIDDNIIRIASANDTSGVRNFSEINFENYQNETAFDLIQHQNPNEYISSPVGDTIVGEFPDSLFTFEGMQFNIVGEFKLIPMETSSLIIQSDTLVNIQRFKLIENYALIADNNEVANYVSIYYSFFDKGTNELIFEVFNKKRILKGGILYSFNGVSLMPNTDNGHPSINLTCTPNPSEIETNIHYDLWQSGTVNISISNQNGTVNEVVYTGNAIAGSNDIILSTQQFISGLYVVTVTFAGNQYSTNLIIL